MIYFTFGSAAILTLGLVNTANGDCEFTPTTSTLLYWKIITTNCKPTHSYLVVKTYSRCEGCMA